jgi:hypothetical protein
MSVSLNDDSSRSGRSRSNDVTESREVCGATVQSPMGFGRIAAADEAGPTQTDATIRACASRLGRLCTVTSAVS